MRLAHLILAHKNPAMLERLAKRLVNQDADVYIQLDKKTNIEDFKYLENIENVHFIANRFKMEWASYSNLYGCLLGFEEILQSGKEYSHINLLSGQDYPLKPIAEIQQFLFANAGKTFMRSLSINDGEWDDGRLRIAKYNFGDYDFPGRYKLNTIINSFMPARKLPYGLKPYGRSQWLTITPECARYCLDYVKDKPDLVRFFRQTWAVDEVYFQTILESSHLRDRIVNDNLRHIEQAGPTRPKIFTIADGEMLVATGKFFARKFDTDVDTEIFDYLDKAINYTSK